jgi:branched-chain amino acid transport system substrate-binding protein
MPRLTRRAAMLLPVTVLAMVYAATEEPVLTGATYPLSGSVASAGDEVRQAIRVAEEVLNTAHPELKDLPLDPTAGLPNLSGRKVKTIFADHQGNPATAQSETPRLITQGHVVAVVRAYQSSCTLTSSAVAERYSIPFVAGGPNADINGSSV